MELVWLDYPCEKGAGVMALTVNLIAFALDENSGSEPGSGWAALRGHLALKHKVRLFTTETNKSNFETSSFHKHSGIEPIYVPSNISRKKFPGSQQIKYHFWIVRVSIVLRGYLKHAEVDEIVHHVTYSGDWNLTPLVFLQKKQKLFWGPIGGCQKIIFTEFLRLNFRGKITELIRLTVLTTIRYILRFILSRKDLTILATNDAVIQFFGKKISAVYCPPLILENSFNEKSTENRIIFSSGRLIPLKNFELQVRAMKFLDPSYKLIIAGDGSEKNRLKRLIKKLELEDRVSLIGELPRKKVIAILKKSHVFAFTSIRDSHSWSLAEAVSLGIPVATIGTPGNIAVIRNGNPTYLPIRKVDPKKFAEYLLNPIQFESNDCFNLEVLTLKYEEIFNSKY